LQISSPLEVSKPIAAAKHALPAVPNPEGPPYVGQPVVWSTFRIEEEKSPSGKIPPVVA
jgi:hypothetical protein